MANPAKLTVRTLTPNWARVWPAVDVIDTTGMVPVVSADMDGASGRLVLVVNARGAMSARIALGDLPPSVRQGLGDLTVPVTALQASLTTAMAGANNDLTIVADTAGSPGNDITVQLIDPGLPDQALRVDVFERTAIRVHLETGAAPGAAIASTGDDVRDAINGHWFASHLVTAARATGDNGTGVVTALAATHLAGGADMDATHAALTIAPAGDNNDADWHAIVGGLAGNDITIAYVDPAGNDQPLAVSAIGSAITVSLATGVAGAITSTANDIIAEVAATPAVAALIWGENHGADTGAGVVTAMAAASMLGGADLQAIYGPFEGARFVQDNGDLNINFEIINGEADVICFCLPRG